jgi:predicted DNA-binding protein (MmcQ/YjbR family)
LDGIFTRPGFEQFAGRLCGATIVRQWRDDSVAKVGGKIFALLDRDPGEISLKASDLAFDVMQELPGIRPAPYFARAGWLAIGPEAPLSQDEIEAYVTEAHRLVAGKLPRKVKLSLGLDVMAKAELHKF